MYCAAVLIACVNLCLYTHVIDNAQISVKDNETRTKHFF